MEMQRRWEAEQQQFQPQNSPAPPRQWAAPALSGATSAARCARLAALPRRWAMPALCSSQWRSRPAGQVAAWQAEESGGRARSVSGARRTGMHGKEWRRRRECGRGGRGRIENLRRSERMRQDCYRARRTGPRPIHDRTFHIASWPDPTVQDLTGDVDHFTVIDLTN